MTEESTVPDSPARITTTRVMALFAADHAVVTPDGKLYVNGGYLSALRFPSFPATLPTLGMAAVLELPFQDSMQDHMLRLGLRGPEDQELPVRVEAQFRTAPTLDARFGDPQQVPFAITVSNIEFPVAGVYQLVLWLDGTEKGAYSIRAIQTPMMPAFLNSPPPTRGA
jgi:hypothetical protein